MAVDRRDLGAIIPSFLDDYPLTPHEFRVYARIARRAGQDGNCYERNRNMGDAIGMDESTVRDAKAVLEAAHLVEVTKRPGRTDRIVLTPAVEWAEPKLVGALREGIRQSRRNGAGPKPAPMDNPTAGLGPAQPRVDDPHTAGLGPAPTEGVPRTESREGTPTTDDDAERAAVDLDPQTFPTYTLVPAEVDYAALLVEWWELRGEPVTAFGSVAEQYRAAVRIAAHAGPYDPTRERTRWVGLALRIVVDYLGAITGEPVTVTSRRHLQRLIASLGAERTIDAIDEAVCRGAGTDDAYAQDPVRFLLRYAGTVAHGQGR